MAQQIAYGQESRMTRAPLGTPISRSAPSGSRFNHRQLPAGFRAPMCI
jgi:hypothetical protein